MNKITTKQELIQLNQAAEALLTNDVLRNAEIRNIQAIISILIKETVTPRRCAVQVKLDQYKLEERINELADRPEYAGRHEIHRRNFNPLKAND